MHHRVEFAHEINGFQVLTPAVLVGNPLAFLARIVQIQHRGDRIYPQAVEMELLDPVQGAGQQEVFHLVAAEVEDQRAPVEMLALAGVGVFVQWLAVEPGQTGNVLGEVRRYPVKNYANVVLVAVINEVAEIIRGAEAAGRRVVTAGLVTPGGVVGVLGDRQQLDMAEAHVLGVVHQLPGRFPVVQELAFGAAPPRTQMDFVDGHRLVQPVGGFTLLQPLGVAPRVGVGFGDDGGGARPHLELLAVGVGLEKDRPAVAVADFKLVQIAGAQIGNEQFPDAAAAAHPHRMHPAIPAIEVADDADPFGVGRPGRKQHAGDAVGFVRVRAQETVGVPVLAFAEQVQVEIGHLRREAVGIVGNMLVVVRIAPDQPVAFRHLIGLALPLEQIGVGNPLQRQVAFSDMDLLRMGQVSAHHDLFILGMAAQHGKGVMVAGFDDTLQFGLKFRARHVVHPVMLTVEAMPDGGWRCGPRTA